MPSQSAITTTAQSSAHALAAGKHLIVEKPLVFTPEEARPLVKQAEKTGLVALVGYMKLFDPGYEIGLERIAAIGKPKSIHVHDFAGRFDRYQQLYTRHRIADQPSEALPATVLRSTDASRLRWVQTIVAIAIST